ncbi:MAG: hypothetical protein ABI395_04085 [Sphingobium sp.]
MYGILVVALFSGALALSLDTFAYMGALYRDKALTALMGQHQPATQNSDHSIYRRVRPERGSITLRAPSGPERIAWVGHRLNAPLEAPLYAGA